MGVFSGTDCSPGRFCPTESLPRWMMAVWLVRILDGADPPAISSRFEDVGGSQWWAGHVERLAELGVTVGCGQRPLRFCPDQPVSRAQMASFLTRAFDLPAGADASFADVSSDNAHRASIGALAAAGVTLGCRTGPMRFCPEGSTTRAQMASFLHRSINVGSRRVGITQGCHNASAVSEDRFVPSVIADPSRCEPFRVAYLDDGPEVLGPRASFRRDSRSGWKKHDPSDKPPFQDDGTASGDWVFGRNGGWYTQLIDDPDQIAKWTFRDQPLTAGRYGLAVFVPHLGAQEREQPGARAEYRIYRSTPDGLVLGDRCTLDQGARAGWILVPDCAVDLEGQVAVYVGGSGATVGLRSTEEHRRVLAVDAISLVPSVSPAGPGASHSGLAFDYPSYVRKKIREAQEACAIDTGRSFSTWLRIRDAIVTIGVEAAFAILGAAIGSLVGPAGTVLGLAAGAAVGFVVGLATDAYQHLFSWTINTEAERNERLQAQRLCHFEDYWRNYYDYDRDQTGRATTRALR